MQTAARMAFFADVVAWMLVNYAYREGAFMSKGGAISLVDGEIISLPDLRGRMAPWALLYLGKREGSLIPVRQSKTGCWRRPGARSVAKRCAPISRSRPLRRAATRSSTVTGRQYIQPPAAISRGFETFLTRLFPDDTERTWFWNYLAHKMRRPWVPMVGVIMVAEEFGTGRGTLFDILELLFGKDYVVPCMFGELTGTAAIARFNARLADALFVVVNEAVAEDGQQQTQRRLIYNALKNVNSTLHRQRGGASRRKDSTHTCRPRQRARSSRLTIATW